MGRTINLAVVDLVDVELSSLLASLCVAFLVLGHNAPKAVTLAGGHQV